jgi:hypothetical protein
MTTEVCLLNTYAAVLAADSATTVTHWDGSRRVERYFKGANKVFQLSAHHPIGLMIYDNAALHSVPWEVLIKEFRHKLGTRACASPAAYADEFFNFLRETKWFFPEDLINRHFELAATITMMSVIWGAEADKSISEIPDNADQLSAVREMFEGRKAALANTPLPEQFTNDDIVAAKAAHWDVLLKNAQAAISQTQLTIDLTEEELAEFGLQGIYRQFATALNDYHTGIVVAGFGERQTFPAYAEYKCFGFLRNKLVVTNGHSSEVTHEQPARIRAFAQTSMIDTFVLGISEDIYNAIASHCHASMDKLITDVQGALASAAILDRTNLLAAAKKAMLDGLMGDARQNHANPLFSVIGQLPVGEMANLAETLINLQSLKERVTKPSESVGGPIDVAVITRSEGLVWVKRKHYFDPMLNPRFFSRQRVLDDGK